MSTTTFQEYWVTSINKGNLYLVTAETVSLETGEKILMVRRAYYSGVTNYANVYDLRPPRLAYSSEFQRSKIQSMRTGYRAPADS